MSETKGFWSEIASITREVFSKTRLANIAAFILVVGGFAYAYQKSDTELMKNTLLLGVGYLFGKSATG